MAVLEIDGSFGEGGGQILRTSLALSLVTGTPFRMVNIRVKREKPGLRRQHLTAVRAAAGIGNAQVEGDALHSTAITFRPGEVTGGRHEFDIGTAGSTTLVFQTVFPALVACGRASIVTFRGGTHNHGGPPYDFVESVFLPAIRRMGGTVETRLARHGFVPAGGGEWTAEITPGKLRPVEVTERGSAVTRVARAVVSGLPVSIAERELEVVRRRLKWPDGALRAEVVESNGPGNVLMIHGTYADAAELATGFGRRGLPAERVARDAVECWSAYEESGAPVGEHLADQLLLPMALAGGGSFVTVEPSLHTTTNADTIGRFLPVKFGMEARRDGLWVVSV